MNTIMNANAIEIRSERLIQLHYEYERELPNQRGGKTKTNKANVMRNNHANIYRYVCVSVCVCVLSVLCANDKWNAKFES